jgi:hypothetical protein
LTKNIELWNTPGHTNQDISVIVRNVGDIGTVAVVGDLFYSEVDALSDGQEWSRDAWSAKLGQENRKRVICVADAIVPGHGKMFRVAPEMRARLGCPHILSLTSNGINTFRSEPQPIVKGLEAIQPTLMTLPPQLRQPNISDLSRAYAAVTPFVNPTISFPGFAPLSQPNSMPIAPIQQQQQILPPQTLPLATQQQQAFQSKKNPFFEFNKSNPYSRPNAFPRNCRNEFGKLFNRRRAQCSDSRSTTFSRANPHLPSHLSSSIVS